jgi:hypothetical protein
MGEAIIISNCTVKTKRIYVSRHSTGVAWAPICEIEGETLSKLKIAFQQELMSRLSSCESNKTVSL